MKSEFVKPKLDFNNRILKNPTAQNLLALLKPIALVNNGGNYYYSIGSELDRKRFRHICYLLGISLGG
ncbi:hypothetical protein [Sporomusa carbonis]|uniref:hypothetical protein n=1 Tax=Sporomusa carbonis TaxID=3076075 RepID=UPI003C7E368C